MTVSGSEYATFTVQWFDETDAYVTNADITNDVKAIPLFTDTGSGEVNEAQIVVDADFGDHLVATPAVFDKHDRFRINVVDNAGNVYDRYFELDDIKPSEAKGEGTNVELQCLGIEYHTQNINVSPNMFFRDPNGAAIKIGDIYEENHGITRQPLLGFYDTNYDTTTQVGNGLPAYVRTHFEFGQNEDSAYNRWMDILDMLAQPVSGGGVLDFFDLGFDAVAVQQIDFRAFSSGRGPNTGTETIENTITQTISEQEGVISNPEGTNILAWGDQQSGSLPLGHSKYRSAVFQFRYRPNWNTSISYLTGAAVVLNESQVTGQGGTHWRASTDTTGTPSISGDWDRITMASEFGNTDAVSAIQYSPWTIDKARIHVNFGAAATDAVASPSAGDANGFANGGNCAYVDQNIVINTEGFFRTFVDSITSPSVGITAQYQYASVNLPEGFRILCINRGIFAAGQLDRNGQEFTNCVAELVEDRLGPIDTFIFEVKYLADSTNNRMQVVDLGDTGRTYEWRSTSSTWVDMGASASIFDLANDCLHRWNTVSNVDANVLTDYRPYTTDTVKFPEITTTSTAWSGNQNSAIQIEYDFGSILDRATSPSAYLERGVWWCARAPFPNSTHGGITEGVGDLYGGGTRSSATWFVNQPAMLDFSNMSWTFDGLQGFNQGESTEGLGPWNAIHFQIGLEFSANLWGRLGGIGLLRCACVDRADNLVVQDVEIPIFQQGTRPKAIGIPVDFPISSFQATRSFKPRWAELNNDDPAGFITPKELDVQNVFIWRKVKLVMLYWLGAYDEHGRFNPEGNIFNLSETALLNLFGGNIKMKIDDFYFKKPLLTTSGQTSLFEIEPDFLQRPEIILYDQLKNVTKAEFQKAQFRHKEFDLRTEGDDIFKTKFGDSFFFKNERLVSDADAGANTIKLVAKRIEYSLTKPTSGPGGLSRRIIGIKRFT